YSIAKDKGATGFSAFAWGMAGSFLGAGVGYAIGESIAPSAPNQSHSFFGNFLGFYKGLVDGKSPMWKWNQAHNVVSGDGLWSANIFNSIKLGNPFEWIPGSKEIVSSVLVKSVRLGTLIGRSEERRVGKECRSRGAPKP